MIRAAGLYFFALLVAATLLLVASMARAAPSPGLDEKLGGQVKAEIPRAQVLGPGRPQHPQHQGGVAGGGGLCVCQVCCWVAVLVWHGVRLPVAGGIVN